MKNQYVGDIGDYGKYSLLSAFANASVKVGINWYLTDNDGSNDGKFTKYLENDALSDYDPKVFSALKRIVDNHKNDRSIKDVEKAGIIKNARFYSVKVGAKEKRLEWFDNSLGVLGDSELIFMDPDNGLLVNDKVKGKTVDKYVLPDEIVKYYNTGHNVVYYCHKGRRTETEWKRYKSYMLRSLPDANPVVLTFPKGTRRSYIFLIHKEDFKSYRKIIKVFLKKWDGIFFEELSTADETDGEGIVIRKSNGKSIVLQTRYDGRVQITECGKPDVTSSLDADTFCRLIGC